MSLKNKFSSRWDDITSFVIKKAAHAITKPLMFVNNLSLKMENCLKTKIFSV